MEAVDSNRHGKAGKVIVSWSVYAGFPSGRGPSFGNCFQASRAVVRVQMTELMVFGSRRFGIVLRILISRAPFVEHENGRSTTLQGCGMPTQLTRSLPLKSGLKPSAANDERRRTRRFMDACLNASRSPNLRRKAVSDQAIDSLIHQRASNHRQFAALLRVVPSPQK